ncbi:MAG: hypothetical protein WB784_04470 [Rhodanobacteraceae bacterium]
MSAQPPDQILCGAVRRADYQQHQIYRMAIEVVQRSFERLLLDKLRLRQRLVHPQRLGESGFVRRSRNEQNAQRG